MPGAAGRRRPWRPPREPPVTTLLGIFAFIVILTILILVHELGHFTMARVFGVRVDEFGLGFPPRVKSWRRGGVLYSINAIPLGGFVKMAGENGEDATPDSFGAKPPWQRFIILAAGPTMNLSLAVLVFFLTFMGGSPRAVTVVTGVVRGSPAAHAGLRAGDRIVALDGGPVHYYEDLVTATQHHLGQRVTLRVQRGSRVFRTSLIPRKHPPAKPKQGAMGVVLGDVAVVRYGPGQALAMSFQQIGLMVSSIPTVVGGLLSGPGRGQVAGPIGIAHLTTNAVQSQPKLGWASLFALLALLSANLGVLNLLPIPALDGGRIVFVLLSWIRGRNLNPQVEGLIHMVGMAMLLVLIVAISYQDIGRWISGAAY